jgi:hypothetical protein
LPGQTDLRDNSIAPEHEPENSIFAGLGESQYSPFRFSAFGSSLDLEERRPPEETIEDDTQSAKDAFYQSQQQGFRRSEAAGYSRFGAPVADDYDPTDALASTVVQPNLMMVQAQATQDSRHTSPSTLPELAATIDGEEENEQDNDRADNTAENAGGNIGRKRKKRGPKPCPRVITPLERYLCVPDPTRPNASRLEPINASSPQTVERIEAALQKLFRYKESKKPHIITNPANHRTYVDQNKCLAHHILFHNSSKIKNDNGWDTKQACSKCAAAPDRPCVKLEWHPDDPNGLRNAILVFYPRPEGSRPHDATWTDAEFYL